jgi:hypothetical protein
VKVPAAAGAATASAAAGGGDGFGGGGCGGDSGGGGAGGGGGSSGGGGCDVREHGRRDRMRTRIERHERIGEQLHCCTRRRAALVRH